MIGKRTRLERIFSGDTIITVFLMIFIALMVLPFYNAIILSFNDGKDSLRGPIYFIPRMPTLDNYARTLSSDEFLLAATNSIIRTITTTTGAILFTGMYAFAVIHRGFRFRFFYIVMGMVTMYFSGGLIPTFLTYKSLGLYDNFLVYILPGLFSMYNAIILMSFFRSIPHELEECSRIDGANELSIFYKIILPISKPVIAVIALFVGVGQWNQWFDCMLYTRNEKLQVLANIFAEMVLTQRYLDAMIELETGDSVEIYANLKGATSTSLMLASMVITTFPIIVLYPFLQKYFVKGIMIGSVKG